MFFHDSPYVRMAVVGSPGWYTFPDRSQDFPYGIRNIPYLTSERIRNYLAKNIVLQLADGDTLRAGLRVTPEADRQGHDRLQRGNAYFDYLTRLAADKGWPLRWQKRVEHGLGHVSVPMGERAVPLLVGDDIPLYRFGTGHDSKKLRVWIQGALHGNEPAGAFVARRLMKFLEETDEGKKMLKVMDVAIVPVANTYGYAKDQRRSRRNIDLNRDQTKLADPVTIRLRQQFVAWNPQVALDIHEYQPERKEYAALQGGDPTGITADLLFLPSGYPNIPESLRQMTLQIMKHAGQALDEGGYTHALYFTPRMVGKKLYAVEAARSPQSSSTSFALNNAVSLFVEIRGIGLPDSTLTHRIECGYTATLDMLRTVYKQRKEVATAVQHAIRETLKAQDPVVVTFHTDTVSYPVQFRNSKTGQLFTKVLPALDALRPCSDLVRKRPVAYILSDTCRQAAKKLLYLGLEVEQAPAPFTAEVEEYHVIRCRQAVKEWEHIYPLEAATSVDKVSKRFPKGTYLIRLSQQRGNLAAALLEPESLNGFVNFRVLPAVAGGVLPFWRELP
jgi:hypothetical protein